jgi:hypothetical protein
MTIKEKWNSLSQKQKTIIIAAGVVLFACAGVYELVFERGLQDGYTRVYEKVCNEQNQCREYFMLDPIRVGNSDEEDMFIVYDAGNNNNELGRIKKDLVVFEGSAEYENAKQEKANIEKREQEQFEKTKAEALAKMEPVIKKVYYNIELKPVGDDGSGIYNFYIDPVAWVKLPYDKKEEAFKSCATYALLKSGFGKDKMNAVKVSTKILSSSNKAVLAQYTVLKGIQVK